MDKDNAMTVGGGNQSQNSAKIGERTISLMDLWRILATKWVIMLVAAVLFAVGLGIYRLATYKPQYKSTATIYILKQGDESSGNATSSDFSLALNVVKDCTYIIKSHTVLDDVISKLDLKMSYSALNAKVSTSNPANTRVLEVSVVADTPELAKEIVDAVCVKGVDAIADAMTFKQANLYENGTLPKGPCNKWGPLYFLAAAVAGAVLVYLVFLVIFLLDDSIQSDEDIQNYLGLSILGNIPNASEASSGKKYGRYGGYYGRGYGRGYGYGYGYQSQDKQSKANNANKDDGTKSAAADKAAVSERKSSGRESAGEERTSREKASRSDSTSGVNTEKNSEKVSFGEFKPTEKSSPEKSSAAKPAEPKPVEKKPSSAAGEIRLDSDDYFIDDVILSERK